MMEKILILSIFISVNVHAQYKLGSPTQKWGSKVTNDVDAPLQLRIGTRLQTVTTIGNRKDIIGNKQRGYQDFYLRRARLQVEAKYKEGIKYYMDLRDDNVNKTDKGESDFNIGDAFIEIGDIFGVKELKFKAFRAKVDVSRSETISSSKLLFLDRAHIADAAAQFVSHNRRAANIQLLGNFDKFYFQVVVGDGVQKGKFYDAKDKSLSSGSVDGQKFMTGAKVRYAPFTGWEDKKPTETYFGKGKHFSVGFGMFQTNNIEYTNSGGTQIEEVSRTLRNTELSFHYHNFSFLAEYFNFSGVIEDFSAAVKNEGSSEGYFYHVEYLIPSLGYISPFFRIESWNRFKEKNDYKSESTVAGINYYLKANNIRLGLVYQNDRLPKNLRSTDNRGRSYEDDKQLKLTTMWYY